MTLIEEAIISGFIGEAISRCTDISWTKIKGSVKNRKNKHQNIESQIYSVVVNVLNQITYNEFEDDQDKIYQAAERLLISYKDSRYDNIEVVRSGLQILGESVNPHKYVEFTTLLYQELCKDDYEELYRQIRLLQHDEESNKTLRIERKVDSLEDGIKAANEKLDSFKRDNESSSIVHNGCIFQNNKKKDYIKNWNSRLFLHIDNDENPITLSDAFIMPDYKMYKSVKRIGFSNNDTLDQIIRKFVNYDKSSTMLISGVPGIGKSSITSWIANKYKNDDRVIILRFRDWENEDLRIGLLQDICNTFFCKKKDLENKILIIDGFDEMKSLNRREDLINAFVSDIKDYENFKCIITSRPAYVESIWFNNVIELKEFDIHKVETFCKVILGNTLCKKTEIRLNLEVLGIPVILYMALMSGIDISKNNTKPELYNRIFSAIGGIFDRFCYKGIGYYGGAQILRDPRNIKEYLQFLRKVAFMMFEEDNLMIEVDANEIPELKVQEYTVKILEFPIKNLFEKNGSHIEFIHKSLYEYFVSEFFYWTIVNSLQANNLKELAGTLGYIFKRNVLSYEILEFLEYKIRNGELNNKFDIINNAFQIMLQDGMSFYVNGHYKNINKCEMQIFANILEFLHLWEKCYLEFDNSICNYLSPYSFGDLNFSKADFRRVNLKGISLADVNLKNANFIGMDLKGIEFECSDLEEANFSNADLSDADLRGANLDEIILDNAILEGTIIDEIQICNLEDIYDLDATKVYLNEKHNIIDYKEYKKSV